MSLVAIAAIVLALIFNFLNGMNDAANAIATTIGKGIVDPSIVNEYIIIGALVGSVIWVYGCTFLGLLKHWDRD